MVTGRAGQLARSLIERAAGWPGIELITAARPQVDLESPGSLADAVRAAAPDVLVNAAAYTAVDQAEDEPERAFRINADAAGEAAAAARDVGARIIQLSTDYVFDGAAAGAYAEGAPTGPLNVYGASKLAGEEQVRRATPDHLILRTSWVYGPFGRNFVKSILAAAEQRDLLTVVDDQRGCPSSSLDLADALLAVLAQWQDGGSAGLGDTLHLAGSGETSWCGLASHVMAASRALGQPAAEVRPIATADWPTRAVRPRNSVLDSRRFEQRFGFRLPDWRRSASLVVSRLAQGEGGDA